MLSEAKSAAEGALKVKEADLRKRAHAVQPRITKAHRSLTEKTDGVLTQAAKVKAARKARELVDQADEIETAVTALAEKAGPLAEPSADCQALSDEVTAAATELEEKLGALRTEVQSTLTGLKEQREARQELTKLRAASLGSAPV